MSKNNQTADRIQGVWNIIGGDVGADRLMNGETMVVPKRIKHEASGPTPPTGARIYTLRVRVQQNKPWNDAVNAVTLGTDIDDHVLTVGDMYPPTGIGEVEKDLVLVNYPEGNGSWERTLGWAEGSQLYQTAPRDVFAIPEQYPDLNVTLKMIPQMFILSTMERFFGRYQGVCDVWWLSEGRKRKVTLASVKDARFNSLGWLAFCL